jgi:hypothetical protein
LHTRAHRIEQVACQEHGALSFHRHWAIVTVELPKFRQPTPASAIVFKAHPSVLL